MTATSQKIFPICKNFIAAMALPVIVAMLGMTSASAGAIFTTDVDCNKVNGNIYTNKTDVWLNGGPDGTGSALEPNTNYCVRVYEPDGKRKLRVFRRRASAFIGSSNRGEGPRGTTGVVPLRAVCHD